MSTGKTFDRSILALAVALTFSLVARTVQAQSAEPTDFDTHRRPYVDLELEKPLPEPRSEFALGFLLTSSPEYSGSNRQDLSIKPIFAYRYDRFKLSSSGGSTILNFGRAADDSGASARLVENDRWNLKASLRIGGGRDSGDSVDLAGIPDVRKTVFARLVGSYKISEHWHADSSLGWDLLGRGNGAFVTTGLGYSWRLTPGTEVGVGTALTWGNRTHMNSLYGVPSYAFTSERPAYDAGSGFKDIGAGISFTTQLAPRWIMFGGIGMGQLLGDAADSPLTTGTTSYSASVGIGWRCCR